IMTSTMTTQIKRQEQMKAEAEKERMRGNLLRAVSHDLRTPLTSIYGACSAMRDNFDALPRQTHMKLLSDVCADAQWLVRMVENLLSVTRVDTSTVRLSKNDTVLEELIDAVLVKFHKHYPDIDVHVEIPEEFVSIPMDAMLISQVLMNLLENAVFHAKGMKNLWLRVEVKGLWAYFYVEDDGCGIPEEKLPKLFTGMLGSEAPMDQSRSSMGIGLSVCSAIIKAHGGEIWANKRVGGGTEVGFRLEMEDENGE
ncbi:MAG: sensor histidine kinase, partial [Firmicutes bacterium CAG:110_56_8]